MQSSTSNVTVNYNTTTGRYEITIAGVTYDRLKFTAVATPSGWGGVMVFLNTDSLKGKLIVDCRDVNGNLLKCDFQVVVFQAGSALMPASPKAPVSPQSPLQSPISAQQSRSSGIQRGGRKPGGATAAPHLKWNKMVCVRKITTINTAEGVKW